MEHIHKDSFSIKATEVLFFENATVEKVKDDSISFASVGPLSVLYFSDYHRFVLQLNDWKYPLLRRLPLIAAKDETGSSRTYLMPTLNGFIFRLRIDEISNLQPIANLETIFSNNTSFTMKGEESPFKKAADASPDDKISRSTQYVKKTSILGRVSESLKQAVEKVKLTTETISTGTKKISSTKKRVNINDIKNTDFRKSAKSSLNKKFFQSGEKETKEFLELRKGNSNLSNHKEFSELVKGGKAPTLYVVKEEIEDIILNSKDLAAAGSFNMSSIKA